MQEDFQRVAHLEKESEKTGGDGEEEAANGGLAGCFYSCHGDELGSYD